MKKSRTVKHPIVVEHDVPMPVGKELEVLKFPTAQKPQAAPAKQEAPQVSPEEKRLSTVKGVALAVILMKLKGNGETLAEAVVRYGDELAITIQEADVAVVGMREAA